jgi:RNA-directed DNA polymerase
LANFAAYDLDGRLEWITRRHELRYTRYADDLTFSGTRARRAPVKRQIERVIRDAGFVPNERKGRYLHPHHRQAVTGIVVNEKLNWPRARRRWIRQEVHYLELFGVDDHLQRRGVDRTRYKEFIYGHVYALNAVRPEEAQGYLRRLETIEWPY